MIQALIKSKNLPMNENKSIKNTDIIVIQTSKEQEINEQGTVTIITKYKKINLTKKINETAKLVKQSAVNTAEAKLAELNKILSK